MPRECRSWWCNCVVTTDVEMRVIDELEDCLVPISEESSRIRGLIASLEVCHHKAERWIGNIIEAIGSGVTNKGLGTRPAGEVHPAEQVWQSACAALSAWCAGCPTAATRRVIGGVPASEMLSGLGKRSPLKEWQVQRVIDKINSVADWPPSPDDPAHRYGWLLLVPGSYESAYRTECPDYYREHEELWRVTARTIIHEGDDKAGLSLAIAIDMLWACHWRFVDNLRIVLDAIGGNLNPAAPFAACGRNIDLLPKRAWMTAVAHTLDVFWGARDSAPKIDRKLLQSLGEPTDVKRWLAASLAKTIRLQINPPDEMRSLSALSGPEWIRY
jgi:hypothetical protein